LKAELEEEGFVYENLWRNNSKHFL
jgi:hypothetical protein